MNRRRFAGVLAASTLGETLKATETTPRMDKAETGCEPLFEGRSSSLLETTAYSPEIVATKRDRARYFELRIYHAPTTGNFERCMTGCRDQPSNFLELTELNRYSFRRHASAATCRTSSLGSRWRRENRRGTISPRSGMDQSPQRFH